VTNLASRLCDEAEDGQILIPPRVSAAIDHLIEVEDLGTRELKGLTKPVAVFNVLGERDLDIGAR
jgi:class 3 adenylate cyclase